MLNARVLLVAALTASTLACVETKKCTTAADCGAGQICLSGECRGGSLMGGGTGGGGSGQGGGGGGSTVVTGCDPNAVDNASRDTDCDGVADGEEYTLAYNGQKTDPCDSDTDGDGVLDGVELGKTGSPSGACTSVLSDADTKTITNPTSADTDGDGLSDGDEDTNHNGKQDGMETDPSRVDSDCDGYSDKQEIDQVAGCASSPLQKDTDGDGLLDGVEAGLALPGADPQKCSYVSLPTFDTDSSTTSSPCNADTDGDGIADGAEDINLNGKVDPGELNPSNGNDGAGPAQQACAANNLRPVTFHSAGLPDIRFALPPTFTVVSEVKDAAGPVRGLVFFNPTSNVAALVLSKSPSGATASAEESSGRAKLGSSSNPLVQTFTTWDGFSGARALYDISGNNSVSAYINTVAQNFLGGSITGLLPAGGSTGPFKVRAEFVRRTNNRSLVVIAAVPASAYTGQNIFTIEDAAGGTALAQFSDYATTTCEVFTATATPKVDFLWVVDDSCSMASSQTAVGTAGTLFGQKVTNAGLDFRVAAVTTGFYGNSWDGSFRDFTTSATTMAGWFTSGSFGTDGDYVESGFKGVQSFVNGSGPNGNKPSTSFRTDAQLHLLFLTDTAEQSGNLTAQSMANFMSTKFPGQTVMTHAIVCPEGQACDDDPEDTPGSYHTWTRNSGGVISDINVFKPQNPSAAQKTVQGNVIDAILAAAIGNTGHALQKPPISATIKVSVAAAGTKGTCAVDDIPRDRTNGWDIDGATRKIVFFGNCLPKPGVQVAVSYKYWIDASPDPDGDPCGGLCVNPFVCNPSTGMCVCSNDCGGACGQGFSCNVQECICKIGE